MTIALLIAAVLAPTATPAVTAAERLAAAKAAGFRVMGARIINECDQPADRLTIERRDLNGDGAPELIVNDNSICYGHAGEMFTVLRKGAAGWTPVLSAQGVMNVLKTKHGGWPDIEIGGPGFGKMPVAKWAGTAYDY